ncbi:hypothetical protein NQZ68_015587 [Dissostichus eleginoides]|nr:hypothetical protein NQZ68_015587 [Dissostichus eleginoides]
MHRSGLNKLRPGYFLTLPQRSTWTPALGAWQSSAVAGPAKSSLVVPAYSPRTLLQAYTNILSCVQSALRQAGYEKMQREKALFKLFNLPPSSSSQPFISRSIIILTWTLSRQVLVCHLKTDEGADDTARFTAERGFLQPEIRFSFDSSLCNTRCQLLCQNTLFSCGEGG